ncbi:hypothetical protein SMICM304S_08333 [Streptomyces microflavus]
MASIGAIPAEEAALTNGSRFPANAPRPIVCTMVASPAIRRLAAMSRVMPAVSRPTAWPMISGGVTTPAYMAAMCWSAAGTSREGGSFSSHG